MASPTAQPAEVDVKELQALIASKKKESAILPLIEKLFTCLVDTDKWLFLSERTSINLNSTIEVYTLGCEC